MPKEKKVVLFGKTGSGKSSVANALVAGGIEPVIFPFSDGARACTKEIQKESGRNWTVVDTVGLGEAEEEVDTSAPRERSISKARHKLQEYLKSVRGGYSHIIYVMKAGRFETIDELIWFMFTKIFEGGEAAFVVLFTGADKHWLKQNFDSIPEDMKKHKICVVDIPHVDEDEYEEYMNVEIRKNSIKKLESDLEGFFRDRNYEYALPNIHNMDDIGIRERAKTLLEIVAEKLKSLFTREKWVKAVELISSLMNIGWIIFQAAV
ncbi:unnamed protein product [Calypogeia fissa]